MNHRMMKHTAVRGREARANRPPMHGTATAELTPAAIPNQRQRIILGHVDTCFAVAMALTSNRYAAYELTRELLTWAWRLDDAIVAGPRFKSLLLKELRRRYREWDAARVRRLPQPAQQPH